LYFLLVKFIHASCLFALLKGFLDDLKRGSTTGRLQSLSKRERKIFQLLADVVGVKEVAEKLCVSTKTVCVPQVQHHGKARS
jgi:DNA-binding NarL/FixJ family response regulator